MSLRLMCEQVARTGRADVRRRRLYAPMTRTAHSVKATGFILPSQQDLQIRAYCVRLRDDHTSRGRDGPRASVPLTINPKPGVGDSSDLVVAQHYKSPPQTSSAQRRLQRSPLPSSSTLQALAAPSLTRAPAIS